MHPSHTHDRGHGGCTLVATHRATHRQCTFSALGAAGCSGVAGVDIFRTACSSHTQQHGSATARACAYTYHALRTQVLSLSHTHTSSTRSDVTRHTTHNTPTTTTYHAKHNNRQQTTNSRQQQHDNTAYNVMSSSCSCMYVMYVMTYDIS